MKRLAMVAVLSVTGFFIFDQRWPSDAFTCKKCGKVNPPNYMICDQCGASRTD